jgi:diamine N-acetyltransferase
LMHHAVNLSKAQAEKGMWLAVWQKNERALHFYQKQGFEAVAEGKFELDATHHNPTWIMLLTY